MTTATVAPATTTTAFEQRLFVWSPLGTVPTAIALFLALAGSYIAIAELLHMAVFEGAPDRLRLESGAFQAVVLSLLVATILGMQRYISLKEAAEESALIAMASDAASVATIVQPAAPARMSVATVAGAVMGVALAFVVVPFFLLREHPALFVWHFTLTVFLGTLFGRGVVMTATGGREFAHLIEHDLKIDLLHVDKLAVIGRRSARNALVWFTCAAVVCLFFVSGGMSDTTYFIIVVCAGMGLWIFIRPMEHVHRRIRAEKARELDRIRDEISKLRPDASHDASAATRLQGLLAYETRIHAVHEWPFDQSTLMRVAAYVLIPAIPWFGEAVVSDIIQHWAH